MRLWLLLVGAQFIILTPIDAAFISVTSIQIDSWAEMLQPWGLDLSDGLSAPEVMLNPLLYWSLVSRLLGWNYSFFAGYDVGILVRSILQLMTAAIFIYQGRGLASSVGRFIPWLRG